eukprot:7286314-Prymnesium_polylepis.1
MLRADHALCADAYGYLALVLIHAQLLFLVPSSPSSRAFTARHHGDTRLREFLITTAVLEYLCLARRARALTMWPMADDVARGRCRAIRSPA